MAYTFKHGDRPLEGYTIQRGIGRGGFGEVYYAISDGGREVALKFLRDNAEVELRGVTQCMNLKSPHLVSIFDVKRNADGDYFIIMEHISGPSLCELLIAEPNGLGVDKAAYFLREIGKGLAYLHDRGIVHRDMKPANIFYEDGHVKIGDYGLSKFISVSRHSAQTTSVGTVHYMAPEVGSGNYHRGIDIYALGVILYEMLLGRVPFEGSSMAEVLMKHLTEQPEVQGLPEPFGKVIRKALEKDPKDRYQNVHEMIDDMLEVGTVRNSLAGFNPNTIASMPRRALADTMPTPVPSPNPPLRPSPVPGMGGAPAVPPQYAGVRGPVGVRAGVPVAVKLPRHVEQRIQRVSDKVARKLDTLSGRPHGRWSKKHRALHGRGASTNSMGTAQRVILAVAKTAGLSVAAGMISGLLSEEPLVGVSTGLMVAGVTLGIVVCGKLLVWLGADGQPKWVRGMVGIGCCAPPMVIACLPLIDVYDEHAFTLLAGVFGMLFFADIEGRLESGARGEYSFGSAFSLGLWGFICCAIATGVVGGTGGHDESFMIQGAAIGAALSLVLQSLGWLLPGHWSGVIRPAAAAPAGDPARAQAAQAPVNPATARSFEVAARGSDARVAAYGAVSEVPYAIPVAEGTPVSGYASKVPLPAARSAFARGFWSVFAFVMLLGMVANVLFPALVSTIEDEVLAHVIGAVACGSLMLFAGQKVTFHKRPGFWQETGCPFLIAVTTTGLGACVAAIAVLNPQKEGLVFAVMGIIVSGLLTGLLLASRFGLFRMMFDDARASTRRRPFVVAAAVACGPDANCRPDAVNVADGRVDSPSPS